MLKSLDNKAVKNTKIIGSQRVNIVCGFILHTKVMRSSLATLQARSIVIQMEWASELLHA